MRAVQWTTRYLVTQKVLCLCFKGITQFMDGNTPRWTEQGGLWGEWGKQVSKQG
ncbi:rCG30412 [Rattus norvegicus]|uniref:RCG30412 n=1 Tax=Rattus norvegicus TaxID=10116 RepID=A6JFR9_RAT|nr:rCG30412 [Rattus norvegicus]